MPSTYQKQYQLQPNFERFLFAYVNQKQMLKKLKSELFSTQTQKLLKKARVDKTHQFIHPKYIYQLSNLIVLNKPKNQLLNFFHKSLNSSNQTLKIKSLIILHACVRVSFDEQTCQFIMNQQQQKIQNYEVGDNDKQLSLYIAQHIINFYILYMKKMCTQRQTFYFLKMYIMKNHPDKNKKQQQHLRKDMNIEVVNHGFKILNLCNYLFQSLQMFNKMGRYFIQYEEIISMYIQILQDFDIYNSYIGKSLQAILVKNLVKPEQYKKQITLKDVKLQHKSPIKQKSNPPKYTAQKQQKQQQYAEQTKHFFVYMRQSQKVLDRLYQFFHIRYYYKIIRNMITIPSFFTIKNQQYNKLQYRAKKIDKSLVELNLMSKYDNLNNTFSSFQRCKTQQNIQITLSESMPDIQFYDTQPDIMSGTGKKQKFYDEKYFLEE